jgi:ligand-binding SRPBCC domain-containing protein
VAHFLEREQVVPGDPAEVFGFYADPRNLESITPPWLNFRVMTLGEIQMGKGTLLRYKLRLHGVPVNWLTLIDEWEPGRRFVDIQLRGPYRLWHHTHEFEPAPGGTLIRDCVRYRLPLGRLGLPLVRRDLERIFDYRAEAVARYFSL